MCAENTPPEFDTDALNWKEASFVMIKEIREGWKNDCMKLYSNPLEYLKTVTRNEMLRFVSVDNIIFLTLFSVLCSNISPTLSSFFDEITTSSEVRKSGIGKESDFSAFGKRGAKKVNGAFSVAEGRQYKKEAKIYFEKMRRCVISQIQFLTYTDTKGIPFSSEVDFVKTNMNTCFSENTSEVESFLTEYTNNHFHAEAYHCLSGKYGSGDSKEEVADCFIQTAYQYFEDHNSAMKYDHWVGAYLQKRVKIYTKEQEKKEKKREEKAKKRRKKEHQKRVRERRRNNIEQCKQEAKTTYREYLKENIFFDIVGKKRVLKKSVLRKQQKKCEKNPRSIFTGDDFRDALRKERAQKKAQKHRADNPNFSPKKKPRIQKKNTDCYIGVPRLTGHPCWS